MKLRKVLHGLNSTRVPLLWPFIVLLGQIISGWRAGRNYLSLPEVLPGTRDVLPMGSAWPGVSIIVPVRNEAHTIQQLLDSLVAQDYPCYEVIVVNDASTDATADIVHSYTECGVRLIDSEGPPSGWTGKNAACWLGARASTYPWLLFVDADTELASLALRSALSFALEQGVEALSLFTQQRCASFWERLLLPFAYQQYFVGVNARRIHSPGGPALANGQFFLINRAAYLRAGGHAANARSIIDDISLATSLKKVGVIPLACRGEQLVAVRMYTGLRAIVEGFGKNSYLFLRHSPRTGMQTAISTALAASLLPLLGEAWRKRSWRMALLACMAYLAQAIGIQEWYRRFGVRRMYALLAPLAAIGFLGIALNSMVRGKALPWKGRRYTLSRTRYHIPFRWFMEMGRAMLANTPRAIADDSAFAVSLLPKQACISGVEHIPLQGSFVLVSNHYQRLDLWIGWSGAVLIDAIAQRRRDIAFHFITTDRARIGRFSVPGTRWLIQRVANVWGLVLVTPQAIAQEHVEGQRLTLLRLVRLLRRSQNPVCIGLMPEGDEGNTLGLKEALPGSGRSLLALARLGLPLVPAAVWEADGQLHAQFGIPFSLQDEVSGGSAEESDAYVRQMVMRRIAALLPRVLRGKYDEVMYGPVG